MYWTNLNPKLNRFLSRIRIADSRFYGKFQVRIRFYPVYYWRYFYARRTEFSGDNNMSYKNWVTGLLPDDRSLLKQFSERSWSRMSPVGKKTIWNKEYESTFELIKWMYDNLGPNPKLRIEGTNVDFYTNDHNTFSLLEDVASYVYEVDLVNPKIQSDEIECDKFPLDKYQYRVILKDKCRQNTLTTKVISDLNEQGVIKVTDRRLAEMTKTKPGGHWPIGDWLYVEDEYNLTLVDLALGEFISRVIKYVKKENK